MLNICRNALRTIAAALCVTLLAATAVLAQSGPIKIGVGLLTIMVSMSLIGDYLRAAMGRLLLMVLRIV